MARSSPQSFMKRQRERQKQQERAAKLERKLIRNEEKRRAKEGGDWESITWAERDDRDYGIEDDDESAAS